MKNDITAFGLVVILLFFWGDNLNHIAVFCGNWLGFDVSDEMLWSLFDKGMQVSRLALALITYRLIPVWMPYMKYGYMVVLISCITDLADEFLNQNTRGPELDLLCLMFAVIYGFISSVVYSFRLNRDDMQDDEHYFEIVRPSPGLFGMITEKFNRQYLSKERRWFKEKGVWGSRQFVKQENEVLRKRGNGDAFVKMVAQ